MLHEIFRYLTSRGHSVEVLVDRGRALEVDGIFVYRYGSDRHIMRRHERADIVITHLDRTHQAIGYAKRAGNPICHVIHNPWQIEAFSLDEERADMLVFNSVWLKRECGWSGFSIVVRPPVYERDFRVQKRGDKITLVSLSPAKGCHTFFKIAKKMPKEKFLGVKGSYGPQDIPERLPENVEIMENTPNPKEIYEKTKILLMPSNFESWGRVAIEGACSGIPTIAQPTPGLRESLSYAGIWADRDASYEYIEHIEELMDKKKYKEASEKAYMRAKELEKMYDEDLENLERSLEKIANV